MSLNSISKKNVYILVGPTSSGKTSLAIELCKKFNGEIISADSRQVVRYMDVGTGKLPINTTNVITKTEDKWTVDNVSIWGYDLTEPGQYFSGYDFALFALNKAHELMEQGKTIFIVGGTGFYIDIITARSQVSDKKPDFELRKELEKLSLEELKNKLMSLNLSRFEGVDKCNKVRVLRALEGELSKNIQVTPLPYLENVNYIHLGLKAENSFLYNRVDFWLDTVWHNGLVDEVVSLLGLGFGNSPQLQGLIYKSVCTFLNGTYSENDAIQRAKYDLHAYIRRQLTWFKKNEQIMWFDIADPAYISDITKSIELQSK